MDSDLLERYSRNITLREIGGLGQKRLSQSKVLVVGAGGLGCPALMYLTASGVGKIGVIDDDKVSLSNLQRQVLFIVEDIGKLKVDVAKNRLNLLNPDIEVSTYASRLSRENIGKILADYDLVLDGTDNFSTRYLVNKYCCDLKKPLLFGAVSEWDGQISLYSPKDRSACFECLFPEKENFLLEKNCSDNGVLGPLVGIVGALMASEAIKFVTKTGLPLINELIIYEALQGHMRRYKTQRRCDCKICGTKKD